jgi:hypothetical protein
MIIVSAFMLCCCFSSQVDLHQCGSQWQPTKPSLPTHGPHLLVSYQLHTLLSAALCSRPLLIVLVLRTEPLAQNLTWRLESVIDCYFLFDLVFAVFLLLCLLVDTLAFPPLSPEFPSDVPQAKIHSLVLRCQLLSSAISAPLARPAYCCTVSSHFRSFIAAPY